MLSCSICKILIQARIEFCKRARILYAGTHDGRFLYQHHLVLLACPVLGAFRWTAG